MSTEKLLYKIKQLEARNKELENQLSLVNSSKNAAVEYLINTAHSFTFIKDINLKYVCVNHTFCDLFKIPHDKIEGKTDYDIFPKDLAEKYSNDDKKVIETGKPLLVEEFTVDANKFDHGFTVSIRKIPCFDESGKIIGLCGLGFNFSEQKKTELIQKDETEEYEAINEELRETNEALFKEKGRAEESEAKFRSYIDNAPDGVFVVDEKGKYVEINQAACKMTGYREEELLKLSIPDLLQPGNVEEGMNSFQQLSRKGFIQRDLGYVTKSGEHRFWQVAAVKLSGTRFLGFTKDITERKQAEINLKESEEKYRMMFQFAGDAAQILQDRIFIDYNDKALSLLEGTKEQLTGLSPWDLSPPVQADGAESKQKANEKIQAALAGSPQQFEWQHMRLDGTIIDVEVSLTAIDIEKNICISIWRDISERKQAHKDLMQSEEKFRKLFESTSLPLCLINKKSTNLEINKKFETTFGYKKEEIPTINEWWDLAYPDPEYRKEAFDICAVVLNKAIKNKTDLEPTEYHVTCKNGDVLDMVILGSLIGSDWLLTFFDITERKQAEEKIIHSEEKYRQLVEGSLQGTIIAQNDPLRIAYASPPMKAISGYLPQEMEKFTPKEITELIYADDRKQFFEDFTDRLSGKQFNPRSTYRLYHKDGTIHWFELYGTFIQYKNEPAVQAAFIDVTDRMKAEIELLAAKEKAEEANKLKTEFLNNMSHEIRTPMNGIIGFSEMFDKPDISDEKRNYYAKIVQSSSHQLLRIIDDILEISTLETKQEKLNETEFCLNDLLMELFSIFNLKSKERNIPIYVKKALHDEQSYITTDKTKLNKILSNLIENAMKYTNEGMIEIGYFIENDFLKLFVKDTGIGISPKNHQLIFERFSQENKEITHKLGGLGLGLSISKENAQLLGGDITLESEKGKGSTFYVTIPNKPTQTGNDSTSKSFNGTREANDKYTILVAEDEEVNYLYLEVLFEDEMKGNYKLIHAINGVEAVDICTQNKNIDLVLMDIKMPIMNGHEATEKIKSLCPDIPIIAQTAYSTEFDKKLALKHGCDDFISKPLNKEKLIYLINKYLKVK